MSTDVRAMARRALITLSAAAVVLAGAPAGSLASSAQEAADGVAPVTTAGELAALSMQAWNADDRELLEAAYAADAVHTATFYDRTNEYAGIDAIWRIASAPIALQPTGPLIELPAPEGELRWVGFADLAGGSACLFRAIDGRIVRHDCLVPEDSSGSEPRASALEGAAPVELEAIMEKLGAAWDSGDLALLEEAYAPDAVHTARFLDVTKRYVGSRRHPRGHRRGPAPGPSAGYEHGEQPERE